MGSSSYELGELLGRGGMGEVLLAHDPKIGRDVALKRMRDANPDRASIERFLREAKVQARLDHPAIAPVHELGTDEAGRPYFTMKRLTGTTLEALLDARSATPQRLLRALVDVCLAVELAHSRRVIHRDLKPANIMLGDYGEVYVIDWGVARVLDDDERPSSAELLGTPGYMAPEQARGEQVGAAADVYALGAILFEILTGERLHGHGADRRGSSTEVLPLSSTLATPAESPATRRPDRAVAPELDAACMAALGDDPATRPTARELADRIQRYLDGDRDLERRRALATDQLALARAALASGDPTRRSDAVHAAGRALALDPSSRDAADLVTSLVVEPPRELPDELANAIVRAEDTDELQRSRRAIPALVAFLLFFIPNMFMLPVLSWTSLIAIYVAFAMWIGVVWFNMRVARVPPPVSLVVMLGFTLAFSRVAGPFTLTPVLICAMLPAISGVAWVNDRPWVLVGWALAAGFMPFVLEWTGVLGSSWQQTDHGVLSTGQLFETRGAIAIVAEVVTNLAFLVVVALYMRMVARDRRIAQRRLQIQAWHLRQLLPRDTVQP